MAMAIVSSREQTFKHPIISIKAPPGEGKTTLAATASKYFTKLGEPADLKDVLWLQFDRGGVDSFAERKLTVPLLDFSTMAGAELINAIKEVRPEVKKRALSGETSVVILDTVSVLDRILLAYHIPRYEKFALYNAQLKEHMAIFDFLKELPCTVLALFHEKYIMPVDPKIKGADAAKGRLEAAGIDEGTIGLDITGQALNYYRGNSSLIITVSKQKQVDGSYQYWIVPKPPKDDGKSRFACLAPKEPAHLGQLFAKIRAACNLS